MGWYSSKPCSPRRQLQRKRRSSELAAAAQPARDPFAQMHRGELCRGEAVLLGELEPGLGEWASMMVPIPLPLVDADLSWISS